MAQPQIHILAGREVAWYDGTVGPSRHCEPLYVSVSISSKLGTITVLGRKVVNVALEISMTWFDMQWDPEVMGYFMCRSPSV
jgi:hypothetical protein